MSAASHMLSGLDPVRGVAQPGSPLICIFATLADDAT
jgi:hypothetical protein